MRRTRQVSGGSWGITYVGSVECEYRGHVLSHRSDESTGHILQVQHIGTGFRATA